MSMADGFQIVSLPNKYSNYNLDHSSNVVFVAKTPSNEKIFDLFLEVFANTSFLPSRNLVYESVNFIPERRIDFALK